MQIHSFKHKFKVSCVYLGISNKVQNRRINQSVDFLHDRAYKNLFHCSTGYSDTELSRIQQYESSRTYPVMTGYIYLKSMNQLLHSLGLYRQTKNEPYF